MHYRDCTTLHHKRVLSILSCKKEIREHIWRIMEEKGIALPPKPIHGRIPNFKGAFEAAINLFRTKEWRKAEIIKVNPDSPQRIVREEALKNGKVVIMPTPRIKEGFIKLDPNKIPSRLYKYASTIKGAFKLGEKIDSPEKLSRIEHVDLIIEGSVAVDKWGGRVGKGGGYGDLEYAILRELELADKNTPIATTVHEIQLLSSKIPIDPWDACVDIIATNRRLIRVENPGNKPNGVLWSFLDKEKISDIPFLKKLYLTKQ